MGSFGTMSAGLVKQQRYRSTRIVLRRRLHSAKAYGGFGGASISIVTKTGDNAFHGSIFEFFHNDVLNANDFFLNEASRARAALKQNQFGFALGGPIKKDKLFSLVRISGLDRRMVWPGQARIACTRRHEFQECLWD